MDTNVQTCSPRRAWALSLPPLGIALVWAGYLAVGQAAWPEVNPRVNGENSQAVALLREGKPEEAIRILSPLKEKIRDLRDPKAEARVDFNWGKANELVGKPAEALAGYKASLSADPSFESAPRAAFAIIGKPDSAIDGLLEAVGLLATLIEQGSLSLVEEQLQSFLVRGAWKDDPRYCVLLWELIDYLAQSMVTPKEFAARWDPLLQQESGAADSVSNKLKEQIRQAYGGRLLYEVYAPGSAKPPLLLGYRGGMDAGNRLSKEWGEVVDGNKRFSALLLAAADGWLIQGEDRKALWDYNLAWGLLPDDSDVVLRLANVLLEFRKTDDSSPDQLSESERKRVLGDLVEDLFHSKGRAYQEGNWQVILRLHTVLGTIYERQMELGDPAASEKARWHFEHALEAQKYVATAPAPNLHLKLARVYLELGMNDEAKAQASEARKQFKMIDRLEQADSARLFLDNLKNGTPIEVRGADVRPLGSSSVEILKDGGLFKGKEEGRQPSAAQDSQ